MGGRGGPAAINNKPGTRLRATVCQQAGRSERGGHVRAASARDQLHSFFLAAIQAAKGSDLQGAWPMAAPPQTRSTSIDPALCAGGMAARNNLAHSNASQLFAHGRATEASVNHSPNCPKPASASPFSASAPKSQRLSQELRAYRGVALHATRNHARYPAKTAANQMPLQRGFCRTVVH